MKINKDTTLAEILKSPKAVEILSKYEVPCLTCPMAEFEINNLRLKDVCKAYGIDYEKLVKELEKI
jgi:hybrid cluster-associated redox disulfide protein